MAIPGSSVAIATSTAAGTTVIAAQTISSKKFPCIVKCNSLGHIRETFPLYVACDVALNLSSGMNEGIYAIKNNANSGKVIIVREVTMSRETSDTRTFLFITPLLVRKFTNITFATSALVEKFDNGNALTINIRSCRNSLATPIIITSTGEALDLIPVIAVGGPDTYRRTINYSQKCNIVLTSGYGIAIVNPVTATAGAFLPSAAFYFNVYNA